MSYLFLPALAIMSVALGLLASLLYKGIQYASAPVGSGHLYLQRANSTASLITEMDTGIQHIDADDVYMAVYA